MPTYEYVCTECGQQLEVVQSFTDDALTECPTCQGRLRKIFGNVGVSFKGSGFYKTDSRSNASKSATSTSTDASSTSSTPASTESSSSSGSSDSTSSDSKAS